MKSTKELRDFLIAQMQSVAEGTQEPTEAKAICNYAQQIYNTLNMEMRAAAFRAKHPDATATPVDWS